MEDKYVNGRSLAEYTKKLKNKMAFINPTGSSPRSTLFNFIHPVGSVYKTSNLNFDPNKKWDGTWQKIDEYECVAYLKADGTTIKTSKNIASFTRDGVNYRVNLSKPLKDQNGIINATCEISGVASEIIGAYWNSTSQFTLDVGDHSGAMHTDVLNWFVEVYGKLNNPEYNIWKRTA